MKNYIAVFFTLLTLGCNSDSKDESFAINSIENVEFAHPGMKDCLLYWANENGWTVVEEVTMLSCHYRFIDSIEGLGQLPNLKKFDLTFTPITNIDLSSNPKLEEVTIRYNPYLEKINLSSNLELVRVFINYNSVTEVDISNLPKISEANFVTNLIEKVNFDGTTIEHISLGGNPIKNIDLSAARSIKDLRLQNAPLESLDVSNLHDLEVLFIDGTGLKNIDVSNNSELHTFSAPGNKIQDIRFDNNPKLAGVSLENNPLSQATLDYLANIDWINVLKY